MMPVVTASIDQFVRDDLVTGEPATWGIAMRPIDDRERAAIFRAIEKTARVLASFRQNRALEDV